MRNVFLLSLALAVGPACADAPRPVTNTAQPGPAQPGARPSPAPQAAAPASGELSYKAPAGWVSEPPANPMRKAQFRLPRAADDPEDASLVIFFFGTGEGGPVRDNIDRWVGQIEQADGSSSRDKAKMETLTINGLKATTVDVTGKYTAEMTPGSGSRQNKPDYRLRGAVVETPGGAYFVKLTGPARTVARWEQEYTQFINSFEFK